MGKVNSGNQSESALVLDAPSNIHSDSHDDQAGEEVVFVKQVQRHEIPTSGDHSPKSAKPNSIQLSPSTPSPSSTAKGRKKSWELYDELNWQSGKTKKQRSVSISKHGVSDHAGKPMRCTRSKSANVGMPVEVTTPAIIRAKEIQSSLGCEFPSFIKPMVRSHVSSCFWMGLPVPFSKSHLPEQDSSLILEDENGEQFEVKYIQGRWGLSGGWRGFAMGHGLLEGDVLIFQLVEPNKMKVYIVRANRLTELDGALGLLNLDAPTKNDDTEKDDVDNGTIALDNKKQKCPISLPPAIAKKNEKESLQKAVPKLTESIEQLENGCEQVGSESINLDAPTKNDDTEKDDVDNGTLALDNKKRKCSISLPPAIAKKNKKASLQKAVPKLTESVEQLENGCEQVGSEPLVGPRFSSSTVRIRDIESFKQFNILVDGLSIDSEIPKHIRVKYFILCRRRNTLLHARLLPGLNIKLIAGTIFETVNIADAIRACKLTTSRDEFEVWEKSLKSFELMGMNVGFLRARLRRLLRLAIETEVDANVGKYVEAKTRKVLVDDEIQRLEAKVVELQAVTGKLDADIMALKSKAEDYEHKFQEEVDAPW